MLGSTSLPTSATATLHTTTSNATPTSPTRPSRLRGLSYLRNYTHDRLHSANSRAETLTRSTSSPGFEASGPSSPVFERTLLLSPRERLRGYQDKGREEARIESRENGWLPTVQGRSGLSRDSLNPTYSNESAEPERSAAGTIVGVGMTRNRASSAQLGPMPTSTTFSSSSSRAMLRRQSHTAGLASMGGMDDGHRHENTNDLVPSSSNQEVTEASNTGASNGGTMPTIRFIPHVENSRSARPSLQFTAVSRTLKQHSSVVRVGRYSDRSTSPSANLPNATPPVGFKSKVVSRRHCEFWCTNGQWYVKDVKSSSGTFLNHVRLSPPNQESRPYPVNDGDVIQLGIDFKGGEEIIFRCVKIRIECNRGWQKSLNSFNTSAHKRLLAAAGAKKGRESDAASTNSSECSICLNPVAPCQALFVAPCSHVWHYKCVRNLIHGPNWPNFLCPNCRFVADLEADVEQPEEWEQEAPADIPESELPAEESEKDEDPMWLVRHDGQMMVVNQASNGDDFDEAGNEQLAEMMGGTSLHQSQSHDSRGDENERPTQLPQPSRPSRPVAISPRSNSYRRPSHDHSSSTELLGARSTTPTSSTPFALAAGVLNMDESVGDRGPLTPRNEAGPFLLDGNGARGDMQR